ncbi:MAG TPA: hypothetical protein VJN63_05745 [Thermoplasmata archaeon]|nr:hypothetical protein [Thermoplasmata archaeon]
MFCNLCGARQGVVVPAQGPAPGMPPAPVAPGVPGPAYGAQPGYPPQSSVATAAAAPPPLPQNFKCNSCGAPMKPSAGLALVVCEYCGAVTTMGASGAQIFQKHFMLDSKIGNEQALEAGGKWLNKGLLRRKVAERSELGNVTLRYVPYWIIPTSVIADFQGTKGTGAGMAAHGTTGTQKAAGFAALALNVAAAAAAANARNRGRNVTVSQPQVVRVRDRIQLQYNIPVVGVRGYTKYQPDDGFQFQLQNKMNFDKRHTGGVEVMSGDVSEAEAKAQAGAFAHKFAEREAKKRVDTLESIQAYPTMYDGELLHAPVWFMEYAHKGKQMFILVDSHSGTVMDGERPAFALW